MLIPPGQGAPTPSSGGQRGPQPRGRDRDGAGSKKDRETDLLLEKDRQRKKRPASSAPAAAPTVLETVEIPDLLTVQELATSMIVPAKDVIKELIKMGTMATINQNIPSDVAQQVARIAFGIPPSEPADKQAAQVLSILAGLAEGHIDPALLNANANSYFSPSVLADYRNSLAPLGPALGVRERSHEDRGGMVFHAYDVTYPGRNVTVTTYQLPDGRLGQFLIVP